MEAEVVVDGTALETISGSTEEILNISKWQEICGYDKIPNISKTDFEMIKQDFYNNLPGIKTEDIYMYSGWSSDKSYYLLFNYKIDRDNISEVVNQSSHNKLMLHAQPDNQILCNHITERYFKLLKHGTYSRILLCVSLLAMFISILQEKSVQPTFTIFIKAGFNKGKTHSLNALVNPWSGDSFSFEDTTAALTYITKNIKDCLVIIDDMSKSKRPGMTDKSERIMRLSGDSSTSSMKMIGGKLDTSMISCMTALTGEQLPLLQDSSYTRMLILDYDDDEVNWEILTQLQQNTSLTSWFYILFIQHSMQQHNFIDNLLELFLNYREEYRIKLRKYKITHRYVDMLAWILSMWHMIADFFNSLNGYIGDYPFTDELEKMILNLGIGYSHKSPSQMFLAALFHLINCNQIKIVSFRDAKNDINFDIFENQNQYFIKSGVVFRKVENYYRSINVDFYYTEGKIRKDLLDNGLIRTTGEWKTSEFKTSSNHSISGFYLYTEIAKEFISNEMEEI